MPRVPDQDGTTVRSQRLNTGSFNTDVSPDLLGGAEVRRMEAQGKTAKEINRLSTAMQDVEDVDVVTKLGAAWKDVKRVEKLRLTNLQGENAKGVLAQAESFFDGRGRGARNTNFESGIEGPSLFDGSSDPNETPELIEYERLYKKASVRQREMADAIREQGRGVFLDSIMAHQQKEAMRSADASADLNLKANIADAAELTISNTTDSKEFQDGIALAELSIKGIMKASAKRKGLSPEDEKIATDAALSAMHAAVVQGFLDASNTAVPKNADAKEYLVTHKPNFTGSTFNVLRAKVDTAMFLDKAVDHANRIASLAEGRRFEELEKLGISNPKMQKAVATNLRSMDSQIRAADLRLNRESNKSMHDFMRGNNPPTTVAELQKRPEWDKLNPTQREGYIKIMEDGLENPRPVSEQDDIVSYAKLSKMMAEDEKAFKKIDFASEYYGKMKVANIRHFAAAQSAMLADDREEVDSIVTKEQILSARLNAMNLGGQKSLVQNGLAKSLVYEAVREEEKLTGKKMTLAGFEEFAKKIITPTLAAKLNREHGKTEKFFDAATLETQLNTAREIHGLTGSDGKVDGGKFEKAVRTAIDKAQNSPRFRRELNFSERAKVIETTLADVVKLPGVFFGSNEKQVFRLTDEEMEKAYVEVPSGGAYTLAQLNEIRQRPKEMQALNAELRRMGEPRTYQTIAKAVTNIAIREGKKTSGVGSISPFGRLFAGAIERREQLANPTITRADGKTNKASEILEVFKKGGDREEILSRFKGENRKAVEALLDGS